MLKTSLLRLSESQTAKKVITRAPISRSMPLTELRKSLKSSTIRNFISVLMG